MSFAWAALVRCASYSLMSVACGVFPPYFRPFSCRRLWLGKKGIAVFPCRWHICVLYWMDRLVVCLPPLAACLPAIDATSFVVSSEDRIATADASADFFAGVEDDDL